MWRVLCQSWVVCRFGGLLVGDGLRINWRRRGILTIDAAARFLRPPSSRTGTPSDGIHCRVNLPHTFRQASIRGVGFVLSAPEALKMLPAALVGEAIAHRPHVVTNCHPFRAADDTNVLDRQDGKEQVFVGTVIPILVVHD